LPQKRGAASFLRVSDAPFAFVTGEKVGSLLQPVTSFLLKSLCGGGVPSSHPSLGLSVFFLSFFFLFVTSSHPSLGLSVFFLSFSFLLDVESRC